MEFIQNLKNIYIINKLNENIIKFLTAISIFTLTVFFTPNFNIISFPILILSSITITSFHLLINTLIGTENFTLSSGLVGFSIATIIIYITQFFVEGYYISATSTIIAAGIYGIISSMFKKEKE